MEDYSRKLCTDVCSRKNSRSAVVNCNGDKLAMLSSESEGEDIHDEEDLEDSENELEDCGVVSSL